MTEWHNKIQTEFHRADQARANGNEGQARVCARRAAGIAIREHLTRTGTALRPGLSAIELLDIIKEDPHLAPDLKLIVDHLTLRVTEDFKLPVDVDLVAEAKKLCAGLLK